MKDDSSEIVIVNDGGGGAVDHEAATRANDVERLTGPYALLVNSLVASAKHAQALLELERQPNGVLYRDGAPNLPEQVMAFNNALTAMNSLVAFRCAEYQETRRCSSLDSPLFATCQALISALEEMSARLDASRIHVP